MKVEIISIGDELLIGQTVNTNAAWIGENLSMRGFDITRTTVIRDGRDDILNTIKSAFNDAELIVVTGGLGPTKDDITKEVLAEYFNTKLVMNEDVLNHVRGYFENRGLEMLQVNEQQAILPEAATILRNDLGTASGMWFEQDGKVLISLPGVPYELHFIMENEGFSMIEQKFKAKKAFYKTMQVQGIGESFLAERIANIEDEIRDAGIGLAYLPQPGLIRLRLSGNDQPDTKKRIDQFMDRIEQEVPHYAFNTEKSLSELVGKLLKDQNKTIGTVESCTGGSIAAEITSISGSSVYFMGSIVSYANELKESVVGVERDALEQDGAVSKRVVEQMANTGRQKLSVDYCIATSGIAGPDGGTDEKPVGTVWIGIASEKGVWSKRFQFGNDRGRNIRRTVLTALNLLRCELSDIKVEKS